MSLSHEAIESLDKRIEELQAFRDQLKRNQETLQGLEAQGCLLQLSPSGAGITASLHNQPGFTSVDNPGLLSTLEFLEEKGFQFLRSSDSAEFRYRAFTFHKPFLRIDLFVFLAEDSPTCRRVIDGFEEAEVPVWQKVTRPIYKFQC